MELCVWFGGSQSKSLSGQARPGRRKERQTQIDWLWRRLWGPCNAKSSDGQDRTFWWLCSKEGQTDTKELMGRPQVQEQASHRETKQEKTQWCRGLGPEKEQACWGKRGKRLQEISPEPHPEMRVTKGTEAGAPRLRTQFCHQLWFWVDLVTSLSLDFFRLPSRLTISASSQGSYQD